MRTSNTRPLSARAKRQVLGNPLKSLRRGRCGVATVELVVCLPVLVLLVFGSIEAASFIFLRQSLSVAAYEAARETVRIGSTNNNGLQRAQGILDARGVDGFNIAFPDGDIEDLQRGDVFSVEVSAGTATNSPLAGNFVNNRTLTARVVMVKE